MQIVHDTEPLALSPNRTALALDVGRTTVFALIKCGKLKSIKVGSRTLIPVTSIKALLKEGCQDAA